MQCRVLGTLQERAENRVRLVLFGEERMKEVDAREVQGIMGTQSEWKGRMALPGSRIQVETSSIGRTAQMYENAWRCLG